MPAKSAPATPKTEKAATAAAAEGAVKRSPRERLLDAASELFYAEGVQSVGIDRVIERAGVAKASLYSTFGSKEELVHAYLDARHTNTLRTLRVGVDAAADPVDKLLAVFDAQATIFTQPDFRGCAFTSARAEAPAGSRIDEATISYRRDIHGLFVELGTAAGASDPEMLASQLQMLYDGGGQAANLDHAPGVASPQRAAAQALIRASLTR